MKQDAPRQEPTHQQQESEQNQEPQQTTRQKQRVRVQDDSDADGRGKRLRVVTRDPAKRDPQKMETDQESQSVPEPHEFARRFDGKKQFDLPPVPEDDDLNATVIEVMTDIEVLLDGSSVMDVFAVNSARRKRVEVSERKMTESDRSFFKKAKELELQSWLDHRVFDLVNKKFADQERIMRARWVLTWKSSGKAKARLCVFGFQDPDLTEVPRDSPTLSTASEALIMQWVASHKYRLIPSDIKTAFLSGDEDVRNMFIAPLDDVKKNAQCGPRDSAEIEEGSVWTGKCTKEMVGQAQKIAHSTWFYELFSRLMRICCGKVHGVLGVHVDDMIGGGNETFNRVMIAVRKEFDFGTWDIDNFRFKGRQISQMPN